MYVGIDLGGTNIAAGVVDENNKIISSGSVPTKAERHYSEIIKDMAELTKTVVKAAGLELTEIKAIGIGSPGTVDSEKGMVAYSNNIRMDHVPMAEELQSCLGMDIPVKMENDANAAALGEYAATGAKAKSFVFITLGTGVGGGIVIDGKLYRGFNCAGGEPGHMIIDLGGEPCTCGGRGCWEAYASVTALKRQTELAMAANPDSLMHKIAEQDGKISGKTAFVAAKKGDMAGRAVVDQYIEYVATGIVSVINIFQPELLVIGGGISKEGDNLLIPIKEYVENLDFNKFMPKTEIRIAQLFNDAGIIGAAYAAKG